MMADTDDEVRRQTIYLPPRIHDALRKIAFDERVSQQQLFREAINDLLIGRGYSGWVDLAK